MLLLFAGSQGGPSGPPGGVDTLLIGGADALLIGGTDMLLI